MDIPRNTPIIVGIGEIRNRSLAVKDAIEPADLMVSAIRSAIQDTNISEADIKPLIESLAIVPPWTWGYEDLPGLVAGKLGIRPSHRHVGIHGGHQPAELCDEAARRVSKGQGRIAVVTGGEALASLAACNKAGMASPPGWTEPDPSQSIISVSDMASQEENIGTRHSVGLPIHVYPMYENSFRAHHGQTAAQNSQESARMYEAFDKIACGHEYSWRAGEKPMTASQIGTVSKRNRMICWPYPLLMNAFNTVNLAAACLITSVETATELGIPREKWVFVRGGAGTNEEKNFWDRPNFNSSMAIQQSIDAALRTSALTTSDIDCFDFYSCFPIVPKLACAHLGLDPVNPAKPISLLGGLTSFGGAGNNYSMHALTEMTRQIRLGKIGNGLVLANGGVLSYQHAICLSSQPAKQYAAERPLPKQVESAVGLKVIEHAEGPAVIETFTVQFDRQGKPDVGFIVGRLRDGSRFLANHGDEDTLLRLVETSMEPIGQQGVVKTHLDGSNLFYLGPGPKI